jgi:hypothetical protein
LCKRSILYCSRKDPDDSNLCLICNFQDFLKHTEEKKKDNRHPDHIVINILDINIGMMDSLANSLIRFDENDKIYHQYYLMMNLKMNAFQKLIQAKSSIKKCLQYFLK